MNEIENKYETIKLKINNHGILTITLYRPEKLNSFTSQMMHELLDVIERIDLNDDIKAAIFTGAGRAFCAGADLTDGINTFDFSQRKDKVNGVAPDEGGILTLRLFDCKKPLISAINGPAVGIGATMQLPMDFRIAANTAKFGFVFSRRGVVPEACSSWFLPRIVGISKALEWCYSGKVFDANEALKGGLINEIASPETLLDRAEKIASEMVTNSSQVSIALTRQMMWKMLGADHPMEAHRIDSRGIQSRGSSSDGLEGVRSFLEKRNPNFRDGTSRDMPDYYPWWTPKKFS